MRKTAIRTAATKIDFCFLCPTMKLPQDSPPTFARIADNRNIKCVTLLHAFKNTCPFQFIVYFRNSSENSGSSSSIVPSLSVRWWPFQKRWRFDETCDFHYDCSFSQWKWTPLLKDPLQSLRQNWTKKPKVKMQKVVLAKTAQSARKRQNSLQALLIRKVSSQETMYHLIRAITLQHHHAINIEKIHKTSKIKLFLVLNCVFNHKRCLLKEHSRQPLRALTLSEKFHSVPKG